MSSLQDKYPDNYSYCYGCGRLNTHGLHIKTSWEDGEGRARFNPEPHHMAMPGFVYGGLIASLVDCHAMATAAGASMVAAGEVPGQDPTRRFVTGSLQVDYLKPTPMGVELSLRARPTEVGERKVKVEVEVRAGDLLCARGMVTAVRLPDTMAASGR
ncbi:MAG: PaaI family thioesterase [Gemmatimonadaceae bacterium]